MGYASRKLAFQNACDRLNELGFDIYVSPATSSWPIVTHGYYTDGERIAYFQADHYGSGVDICTVHIPNRTSGTGFRVHDCIGSAAITEQEAEQGFASYPIWASANDRKSVKKYSSIADFKERSSFHNNLTLLTKENRNILGSDT